VAVVTSTTDVILIITTTGSVVVSIITAYRTSAIKKTGEEAQRTGEQTKHLVNSRMDRMERKVEKQGNEMYAAGLPPTQNEPPIGPSEKDAT
jgi:hypothetical protein